MNPTFGIFICVFIGIGFGLLLVTLNEQPAYALKNFFNCMTEIANKNHKLTIDDVNNCYAKEFHNAPH